MDLIPRHQRQEVRDFFQLDQRKSVSDDSGVGDVSDTCDSRETSSDSEFLTRTDSSHDLLAAEVGPSKSNINLGPSERP